MENTNLKRLAAMCAATASLSTLGLAGTAMAVETPTTGDTAATVDLYADWAGLQSTLPQAGGILHAAPVAGISIMMLGVPLLILARRHRHGHANPPV